MSLGTTCRWGTPLCRVSGHLSPGSTERACGRGWPFAEPAHHSSPACIAAAADIGERSARAAASSADPCPAGAGRDRPDLTRQRAQGCASTVRLLSKKKHFFFALRALCGSMIVPWGAVSCCMLVCKMITLAMWTVCAG
eukprot:scaffold6290_cov125-Isochrysis_galbana.AAC.2